MRFGLKGTGFGRWSQTVAFIAVAFVLAATQGSLAKDWSCTPPVDGRTAVAIAEFTGNKYVIDGNLKNIRFVENTLKERLRLKNDLAPCSGKICTVSNTLWDLLHVYPEYRHGNPMTVCSVRSEDCPYKACVETSGDFLEVAYFWAGGMLIFHREVHPEQRDLLNVNEMVENNFPPDPAVKDSFMRRVGISPSSVVSIQYTVFAK